MLVLLARLYANFMTNSIEVHAVLRLSWGFENNNYEIMKLFIGAVLRTRRLGECLGIMTARNVEE